MRTLFSRWHVLRKHPTSTLLPSLFRFATTGPTGDAKESLRQVFKLIHPDRFAQHPKEQAANLLSFQKLMTFLDAKEDSWPERHALELYLWKDDGQLKKVDVHVTSGGSSLQKMKELNRLFHALDLPSDFSAKESVRQLSKLANFLYHSGEMAMNKCVADRQLWHDIYVSAHRIKMQYGVRLLFDSSVNPARRLQLLQQQLLDDHARMVLMNFAVHGGSILLSENKETGLRWDGLLQLHMKDDTKVWKQCVLDLPHDHAATLRENARKLRYVESVAAQKLSVPFVHGDPSLESSQEYKMLLYTICKDMSIQSPCMPVFPQFIPPVVITTQQPRCDKIHLRQGENIDMCVDSKAGIMMLVWDVLKDTETCKGPGHVSKSLLNFVTDHIEDATKKHRSFTLERTNRINALRRTKVALGCVSIRDDEFLDTEQIQQCCHEMYMQSEDFKTYSAGLSIFISNEYGVKEDGCLVIPWNWFMFN